MIESRKRILQSIMEHSSFTKVEMNDIGYSLTEDAILEIQAIMKDTTNETSNFLNNATDQLIEKVRKQIENDKSLENHVRLIHLWEEVLQSTTQTNATSMDRLMEQLQRLIHAFNVTFIDIKRFKSIEINLKNLNTFQTLVKNGIDYLPNDSEFQLMLKKFNSFDDLKKGTQNKIGHEIKQLIETLSTELINIDRQVASALQRKLDSKSIHSRKEFLENHCCRSCNMFVTLGEWAEQVKSMIHTFNITSINTNQLNIIKRNETQLNRLKWLYEYEIRDSIKIPMKAVNYPCSMHDWYTFLIQTYNDLSEYEVQKDTKKYLKDNSSKIRNNAEKYLPNLSQTE